MNVRLLLRMRPVALVLLAAPAWSQAGPWVEAPLTTSAASAYFVVAADVDGDGDLDAFSASFGDDTVAWYANTVGDGSVWVAHTISSTADGAVSVFAADVDGDGDVDALSASENDDEIDWYENVAGDGSVWTEHVISSTADFARSVSAADLDGDGDVDALSTSINDGKVAWYENLAGDGSSWAEHPIVTGAQKPESIRAADVDADGDLDVLLATAGDDRVGWYENLAGDGSSWAPHLVTSSAQRAFSVYSADVDGDGDLDVLSASLLDDKVAWYANLDGLGTSWSEHPITTTADNAHVVFAIDVDRDGDVDALSASSLDDTIAWYENTAGDGSSWTAHVLTTTADGATSVFAADLDGDADVDVLFTAALDDTVGWFENLQVVVAYGSGVDPHGSLTVLSGTSAVGDTLVLGVDNPLGTQAPGALAILALSLAPDPHFPAGTLVPGYGMAGAGAAGELLVGLFPGQLQALAGGVSWAGPGMPAAIDVAIPGDPSLAGLDFYAQGLLLDSSAAFGVRFGLTEALRVQIVP